jgi:hypothetical protein
VEMVVPESVAQALVPTPSHPEGEENQLREIS